MNIVIAYVMGLFGGMALHEWLTRPTPVPNPPVDTGISYELQAAIWHRENADGDLHSFAPSYLDCLDCRFLNPHLRGSDERTR